MKIYLKNAHDFISKVESIAFDTAEQRMETNESSFIVSEDNIYESSFTSLGRLKLIDFDNWSCDCYNNIIVESYQLFKHRYPMASKFHWGMRFLSLIADNTFINSAAFRIIIYDDNSTCKNGLWTNVKVCHLIVHPSAVAKVITSNILH